MISASAGNALMILPVQRIDPHGEFVVFESLMFTS
jgi:hypothetical protein